MTARFFQCPSLSVLVLGAKEAGKLAGVLAQCQHCCTLSAVLQGSSISGEETLNCREATTRERTTPARAGKRQNKGARTRRVRQSDATREHVESSGAHLFGESAKPGELKPLHALIM